jgi:hypothetical protein
MGALTRKELRQVSEMRIEGLKVEARDYARSQVSQFLSRQEGFAGWLRWCMSEREEE